MNFRLDAILTSTFLLLVTCQLRAQDIDTLEHQYHQLSHEHRHATCEHFLLKMLDASPTPSWKAASFNRLGLECKNQGRYDDAEKYYLAGYKESISFDHVNRGWIPNNLAIIYLEQGKLDDAERWANLARSNWEAGGRGNSTQMASTLTELGRIQSEKRQFPQAEQSHRSAMMMRQSLLGADSDVASYSMSYLGRALAEQNKLDDAESLLNTALAIQQKLLPKDDYDLAWTKSHLAFIAFQRGDINKAEQIDRAVLDVLERVLSRYNKRLPDAYANLARDLDKLGETEEATTMKTRASEAEAVRKELVKGRATKEVSFEVEVVSPQADIKASATVIAKAKKGDRFQADHVDGPWYAVATQIGDERKVGYFYYRDIAIINENLVKTEIRWQQVSPPAGRFEIQMPGTAKLTKQTVNGADNYAYEVNVGEALYIVSYFDIPAGSVLPFDAAMGAYTTARKGEVVSQKALEKDLYPGREFVVKLPTGQLSRMQLIQAGKRWFTLTVEASQATAFGNDASKFIDSFKINE